MEDVINIPDEQVNYTSSDDESSEEEDPVRPVRRVLKPRNSASGMSQKDLRETIKQLQRNDSIGAAEKAKRIQALMTTSWRESQEEKQKRNASEEEEEKPENDGDYKSYVPKECTEEEERDEKAGKMYGCQHYQRGCNINAPCCDRYYPCRFCHDEKENHAIDRYAIENVQCMDCGTKQKVGESCVNCGMKFAKYFCEPCKFYDNKEGKDIYHCPYCNICRIGKGLGIDYFHCSKCNACMSITLKEHKCVERSLESNCPVCHDYMFTSTIPVMFLPCGHCMHVNCYEEYTKTNYVCPICSKSLGNMSQYFERIDNLLKEEKMPPEFQGLFNRIFCADCEKRCVAPFHFLYHKCTNCESYNTKVLETLPRECRVASSQRS